MMRSTKLLCRILSVALVAGFLAIWMVGTVYAQTRPLNLTFVSAGGGPPDIEVLPDGTLIFKVTVLETISGDLTGTLTERITQVYPLSEENGLLPITTTWTLETADGTISGYYSGLFQHMRDGTHFITEQGEVLSVTGAYVNLYQARVSYRATLLADHMTASGSMTVHPRERR